MSKPKTVKNVAKEAKSRLKNGFWMDCKQKKQEEMDKARDAGVAESRASKYFVEKVGHSITGEKEDEFYLKVKDMLLTYGEVSDAIGRLTDKDYFEKLSYEERQRYTLALSTKYLLALERFKKEVEFERCLEKTKVE